MVCVVLSYKSPNVTAIMASSSSSSTTTNTTALPSSRVDSVGVVREAEEAISGSTVAASARTAAVFLTRTIPRIPAAKFFRPKAVQSPSPTTPHPTTAPPTPHTPLSTATNTPSIPLSTNAINPKHASFAHFVFHLAGGTALFTAYTTTLDILHAHPDTERVHGEKAFLAGAIGGIAHTLVMTPVHNLHHTRHLPCHGSQVMLTTWRHTRPTQYFRGLSSSLAADMLGFGMFFFAYESVRQLLDPSYLNYAHDYRLGGGNGGGGAGSAGAGGGNSRSKSNQTTTTTTTNTTTTNNNMDSSNLFSFVPTIPSAATVALHASLAGAIAGVSLELIQYPIHHIQHHLSTSTNTTVINGTHTRGAHFIPLPPRLIGMRDVFAYMAASVKKEGLTSIYKGMPRFLAGVVPSSSLTFLAYEMTMMALRHIAES